MKIVLTQPCTEKMKGFYENAIRNTQMFFNMLIWAKDPQVKQPWIRAGLLNDKYAAALNDKILKTKEGTRFSFSLEETIQLYTCIDICCKYYLSPFGERVKQVMVTLGKTTAENLQKDRKFTLGSSENIIRDMKEAMKEYPRFKQAVSELNNLPIDDFESELLDGLI